MPLTIYDVGIVPSVERFVPTNWLLRHLVVLGVLVVFAISASIVTYVLVIHYGGPMHFSSSDPRAGFQPAPSGRDTMDIVSSCASTLITCIYSSVHFNIPRGQSQRLVFKEKLRSRNFWLDLWVKVTFWLLAIFSPEMVVLHAFYEHMVAKRDVKWMKEKGHEDWSMTLAFFADMGGFVLEGKDMEVHSGFAIHEELFRNKNEPGAIDCKALEYDIADRTKADLLFKLLTTLQIFRFVVGTAVRLIVSLPVAPLETITCAYVACTLVYYGLWFKKPYNVNERIVVKINPRLKRARPISEGDIPKPGFQELEIEDVGVKGRKRSWSRALKDFFEPPMGETDRLHGSTHMYQTSPYMTQGSFVAAAGGLLVGLAHLACWNVEFPNSNGQPLWRYCSLLLIILPLAVFFIILGAAIIQKRWVTVVMNQMALTMIVIYCVARIILLILLGQSFESLPAGVYETRKVSWLSYIPFIH